MKRTFITASLVIFLSTNLLGSQANAAVTLSEGPTCATWAEAQSGGGWLKAVSQAHLMGFVNGVALGADLNFWIEGGEITNDQVFFWMDRYCDNNPLKDVTDGVIALFVERFPE